MGVSRLCLCLGCIQLSSMRPTSQQTVSLCNPKSSLVIGATRRTYHVQDDSGADGGWQGLQKDWLIRFVAVCAGPSRRCSRPLVWRTDGPSPASPLCDGGWRSGEVGLRLGRQLFRPTICDTPRKSNNKTRLERLYLCGSPAARGQVPGRAAGLRQRAERALPLRGGHCALCGAAGEGLRRRHKRRPPGARLYSPQFLLADPKILHQVGHAAYVIPFYVSTGLAACLAPCVPEVPGKQSHMRGCFGASGRCRRLARIRCLRTS